MRIVQTLKETEWRRFIAGCPESTVFHTPELFQVFAGTKGHRPTLWAAIESDGQVLALLLPVQITLIGGLIRRWTTRAVAYGSVLYAPGLAGKEALMVLLRTYVQEAGHGALFTELRNLSDLSLVQPVLDDCGFVYKDHLNYMIDLARPVEEIMQGIGARTRKHIRRGLRRGEVMIEEVRERDLVSVCYDLLHRTYVNAQVPLVDRSLFEAAFDILYPKNMIRVVLARVGDVYVGTSVELLHKDVVYGWYGGVDRDYGRYVPNELLMWNILQWGAKNGYRVYDFGGAGSPDEEYGVRDFKAKFGGSLVCFGRNICVHAPRSLWLSERGYRLLRRWL